MVKVMPDEILNMVFEYYSDESKKLSQLRLVSKQFEQVHTIYQKENITITKETHLNPEHFSVFDNLKTLKLQVNCLTAEIVTAVATVVGKSPKLKILEIEDIGLFGGCGQNRIPPKALIKSISSLSTTSRLTELRKLKLPSSILSSDKIPLLATALAYNIGLEELDLNLRNVTSKTNSEKFFCALKSLRRIKSLAITGFHQTQASSFGVLDNFFFSKKDDIEFNFENLITLKLNSCNFIDYPNFYPTLFSKTVNLKNLSIQRCNNSSQVSNIHECLNKLQKLEDLDLSCNRINIPYMRQIVDALSMNRALVRIDLSGNECDDETVPLVDKIMLDSLIVSVTCDKFESQSPIFTKFYTRRYYKTKTVHENVPSIFTVVENEIRMQEL